jgi:putative acetyltransferase
VGCGRCAAEVTRDISATLAELADELDIGIADPRTDDVRQLIELHLQFGRSHSPPQDAHALEVDGLLDPGVTLFSARGRGELLAIAALKRIDDQHAELKTLHTVEHARGRGIGRAMLDHLLVTARDRGFARVSLETGSMEAFAPARSLYASTGFGPCGPFGDYRQSPNSSYMSKRISSNATGAQASLG